jgi:acetyl-CoA carboxylase carboxyl transferase subunit alpha
MEYTLEFERPVFELENQIRDLKSSNQNIDLTPEIKALQAKVDKLISEIYKNLSPWERTLLSRHPSRPHAIDYIQGMISDFHEIHGDRRFSDDASMICGFGYLEGQRVAICGIEKGRKTQEKIRHNFGMAQPEGYRKALRLMELASQFNVPVLTFVDTPGAYPGIGAEERGQALAIAENLEKMFGIKVPIITVVIGEGGSGGALGIAIADKVLMMEYSVYSVISPESCASILWSDSKMAETAANALQLSPLKAMELKVIDDMIGEPIGGAHRYPETAIEMVKTAVTKEFEKLKKLPVEKLLDARFNKFRQMGNTTIQGLKE